MMSLDDLVLEPHTFTHVRVMALAKFDPSVAQTSNGDIASQLTVKGSTSEANQYIAQLRVQFNTDGDSRYPYAVDISCMTTVKVKIPKSEAEDREIVAITAHQMLFPAIREMAAMITARQPWGQMTLGFSQMKAVPADPEESPMQPPKKRAIRRKKAVPKE